MKTLKIDETWSISYDPSNNDRPVMWMRYGESHSKFDETNAVVALFYALLEASEPDAS